MLKRSSKKPSDLNQLAASIVQQATGEGVPTITPSQAAAALGRLGGLKGGKARARRLSAERRREIAKLAAKKRWKRPRS